VVLCNTAHYYCVTSRCIKMWSISSVAGDRMNQLTMNQLKIEWSVMQLQGEIYIRYCAFDGMPCGCGADLGAGDDLTIGTPSYIVLIITPPFPQTLWNM
jgi:hypothetical protein